MGTKESTQCIVMYTQSLHYISKMSRVAPAPDDFDGPIAALEREKAAAVSREDYGQAHAVKGQIEALRRARAEAREPEARQLTELQRQKADAVRSCPADDPR